MKNTSFSETFISNKVLKFQKKILRNKHNFRKCRNYQRLLRQSSLIQFFIIQQIFYQNSHFFLNLTKYTFFLQQKIHHQLWVLALSPMMDHPIFIDRKDQQLYLKLCLFFKPSSTRYIVMSQLSNFFNKKTKKWLLSNLCIEKKLFFQWFLPKPPGSFDHPLLKKIFKNWIIFECMDFIYFSIEDQESPFHQTFLECNHCLLISLKKKKNLSVLYKCFHCLHQKFGFHVKFCQLYSLSEGLNFSGWFFRKNSTNFLGVVSLQNITYHKKELQRCFKNSTLHNQSIDQTIFQLNQKIHSWQRFYKGSMKFSQTCSLLNKFLFEQIWLWIKKRHRNKSSKWLYNRYWTISKWNQWIFSFNNETFIFYRSKD